MALNSKKEEKQTALKPIKCLRGETVNEITNRFCKTCSLPIQEDEARVVLLKDANKINVSEIMTNLLQDQEVLEMIARKCRNQVLTYENRLVKIQGTGSEILPSEKRCKKSK